MLNTSSYAQAIEPIDSNHVKISITELKVILKTFYRVRNQEQIIATQEKRFRTQQRIIADRDSTITLYKKNENLYLEQIEKLTRPFYDSFIWGVIATLLLGGGIAVLL